MNLKQIVQDLESSIDQATRVLKQLKAQLADTSAEARPVHSEESDRADAGICLYCHEPIAEGDRKFRGTHQKCYKKIYRAKADGLITDRECVERGWMLPPESGGRKPRTGSVAKRLEMEDDKPLLKC